jgi:ketosteroid isomerase-like protein
MDLGAVQRWLDDYIAAWRSYDPQAIKALFSPDVAYWPSPYVEPLRGPEAVAKAWIEENDPPDSWTADYRAVAVAGDIGVGRGITLYRARDGRPEKEYANLFLLRFDDQGRCREYTEWFMKRPEKTPAA